MYLLFLWQPENLSPELSNTRFNAGLNAESIRYREAFGYQPSCFTRKVGGVHIGLLHYDPLVVDWQAWLDKQDYGLVWGGICESLLGLIDQPDEVLATARLLKSNPAKVMDWDGRFHVASWDHPNGPVRLTTAATESPTLWKVHGHHGWAYGSRSSVLLDLVGQEKRPNMDSVGMYCLYGYLAGPESLFSNVRRLNSRRQVILDGCTTPRESRYASLGEYLFSGSAISPHRSYAAQAAEQLARRVERQLKYSNQPLLLLSGGRDSRCIAAAASSVGYEGEAFTAGADESAEVVIATQVAERLGLGLRHRDIGGEDDPVTIMTDRWQRVRHWNRATEGIETLRHLVSVQDFLLGRICYPRNQGPVFHGLVPQSGAFFGRWVEPNKENGLLVEDFFLERHRRRMQYVSARGMDISRFHTIEQLRDGYCEIQELETDGLKTGHFRDLYYWQNRCLHWGEDLISAKAPIYWLWTPLMDRKLLRISLDYVHKEKSPKGFREKLAIELASQLKDVGYSESNTKISKVLNSRYLSIVQRQVGRMRRGFPFGICRSSHESSLARLWHIVFCQNDNSFWPSVIESSMLKRTMRREPNAELLWSLATVELFFQLHCSGDDVLAISVGGNSHCPSRKTYFQEALMPHKNW